jgi:hypothetical protein
MTDGHRFDVAMHAALAAVHAASAIALLVLLHEAVNTVDLRTAWAHVRFVGDGREVVELSRTATVAAAPGTLAAVASLVSAAAHVAAAVGTAWFGYAERYVHRHRPWLRWCDYAVSAPTLLVAIATLCGVWDAAVLVTVALCMAACIAAGARAEIVVYDAAVPGTSDERAWLAVAWAAWVVAWFPIVVTFGVTAGDTAPAFVWVVVATMMALYAAFGVVGSRLAATTPEQREWLFGVLSATCKVALHWLVYAGSARPDDAVALYVPMGVALALGCAVVLLTLCSRRVFGYSVVGA